MKKAVIFDLDGTLLDTSKDICRILNFSLRHFALPELSLEKTVEYVGNGAKKLVERALPQGNEGMTEEVYRFYAKHFAECDNSLTRLYEGEDAFLKRLKSDGVKTAIVTNKPQAATDGVYAKLLSAYNFDCVVGQTDEFPLKPDAASTLEIIKILGVDKKDCLFVGDGETDILTAKNAGIDCISVLWGFRTKTQLAAAGAKYFAADYEEIAEFVFNAI